MVAIVSLACLQKESKKAQVPYCKGNARDNNFCRNSFTGACKKARPWCYVRYGKQLQVWTYCDIPMCREYHMFAFHRMRLFLIVRSQHTKLEISVTRTIAMCNVKCIHDG